MCAWTRNRETTRSRKRRTSLSLSDDRVVAKISKCVEREKKSTVRYRTVNATPQRVHACVCAFSLFLFFFLFFSFLFFSFSTTRSSRFPNDPERTDEGADANRRTRRNNSRKKNVTSRDIGMKNRWPFFFLPCARLAGHRTGINRSSDWF